MKRSRFDYIIHWNWLLLWTLLSPLASSNASEPSEIFQQVSLSDNSFFAHQDKEVVFRFRAPSTDAHYGIIRVDENGKMLKYLGAMTDSGILGDKVPGDAIFGRKLEFKQNRTGTLYFHIIQENAARNQVLARSELIRIEVLRRPSFLEVSAQAFKKFWQ